MTLERLKEGREDEKSLKAPTVHLRLSYADAHAVMENDEEIELGAYTVKRRPDDAAWMGKTEGFTVYLDDHHIEKACGIGDVVNFGIRNLPKGQAFLFVSIGGISDKIT